MIELRVDPDLDLRGTLSPMFAGAGDPTQRATRTEVLRASRTPDGPATLLLSRVAEDCIRARAWGPGADWMLAGAADLVGLADDPVEFPNAAPPVRNLARRARGVRLPRSHRVVELLVLIVLQQLVSWREASRAFRNLVQRYSAPAPGPVEALWLPLGADLLRALPIPELPPLGVLERQGRTLVEIGFRAARLEEADAMDADAAEQRLRAIPGIGVWSARSALLRGMGHPDAVPLGDYNLPNAVAYALAGEEHADDARMLALLEPYRGQRGRIIRWIHAAGHLPRRRTPRAALRSLPKDPYGRGTGSPWR